MEQKNEKVNKSNEQERYLPSESISPSSIASRDTSTRLDVCGADFSVIKNWMWSDSSTSFFRGFGGGMIASHFGRSKLSRLPWRANFSPKYFDSKLFIHFTNGPNGPYLDVCFGSIMMIINEREREKNKGDGKIDGDKDKEIQRALIMFYFYLLREHLRRMLKLRLSWGWIKKKRNTETKFDLNENDFLLTNSDCNHSIVRSNYFFSFKNAFFLRMQIAFTLRL